MLKGTEIIQIGNWVKGTTKSGELFLGYIEDIHSLNKTVKVKVVHSDHDIVVGKTIETLSRLVQGLPSAETNEEGIRELIELSLITKDEDWFYELQERFVAIRKASNIHKQSIAVKPTQHNRIDSYRL
ncbi:hypothetical protein [Litchfieldia salsa]|uniref:IDEAL domain-containing protein n=1 Tax=Litchfieldia salsa TaxID=930152 RepID=A0A1H0Q2U3_9BACI|nr:hypothetical protein [Litchfieldia salsa]SDP11410.1 hypothetical protein SAMN05216565_101563 [Litchfieldia salsa]